MANTRSRSTRNRGAAARAKTSRAEKNGQSHKMEWHGLEVEIPPVPLSSVILRAGRLRDDDWEGAVRLLEAIVGPQMFGRIMDRMDEKNMVGDEGLTELGKLIGEVFNIYGFTPGESQASRSS